MDDPLVVGLLERLGDLPGHDDGLVDRQRPALQPLGEVLAVGESITRRWAFVPSSRVTLSKP